ncbi:hypothetical protein [Stieleria varia]|uniref:DUF1772 domain-containing protein n=1 Tax=Stieleria varia TaxID=2528005 RepID=A0A5C5ZKE8_9BACT|nr:hypothetical protein [Stieleria varia]TWT87924.1 hypothetical protein Pla52n_69550 [Stieleria varia]
MSAKSIFVVHVMVTWYLVGLIWTVQVVHYNLFDRVGTDFFSRYEADHNRLITPIVGPAMLLELATAVVLLLHRPEGVPGWVLAFGLAMVLGIWLSTVFIQVPCHARLMNGFDESIYRQLVSTNWIRTVLWTSRGFLMGYFLMRLLADAQQTPA